MAISQEDRKQLGINNVMMSTVSIGDRYMARVKMKNVAAETWNAAVKAVEII